MPNELLNASEIFSYNPENGEITWLKHNKIAGYVNKRGYRLIKYNGVRYKAHRIAWILFHGETAGGEMDHINGVKDDNRINNLRVVSTQENQRNTKLNNNNTSGHMGVHFHSRDKKWVARIKIDGKYIHLGYYSSIDEAVDARKKAEIKYGFHKNHGRLTLNDMM